MVKKIKNALRLENISLDEYFIEKVLFWNEELKKNKDITIIDVESIIKKKKQWKPN